MGDILPGPSNVPLAFAKTLRGEPEVVLAYENSVLAQRLLAQQGTNASASAYEGYVTAQQGFSVAEVQAAVQAQRLAQATPQIAEASAPAGAGVGNVIAVSAATGAAIFSLTRGVEFMSRNHGDLPKCVLPDGSLQRIFELCDGVSPNIDDVLDLVTDFNGGIASTLQLLLSHDPNDISGPAGHGAERFVADRPLMPFTIMFENLSAAQGPAAEVVVTHKLDDDLDLETFELGDFGLGDLLIEVPRGRQFYNTRLDLRSTRGVYVEFTAGLDRSTGIVTWRLTAIDPATLDIPIDPFTGFLPPNQTKPEGEGFVNYMIRPKADSATGTRIEAQARIVFDTNDPIDTPIWMNTLDVAAPSSAVAALPAKHGSPRLLISWSGHDELGGSGVATYDIYMSVDGGEPTLVLDDTTATSAEMSVELGRNYAFLSVATDHVGHVEARPLVPDATTTIVSMLAGDLDRDGFVGLQDLAILQGSIGSRMCDVTCIGDLTGDGDVDRSDAALLARNYGRSFYSAASPAAITATDRAIDIVVSDTAERTSLRARRRAIRQTDRIDVISARVDVRHYAPNKIVNASLSDVSLSLRAVR